MLSLTGAVFVAVMCIAMVWDVRTRRIPNGVIGAGLALALALHAISGFGSLGGSVLGAGVALAIAFPSFGLGVVGGGDAKLLIVVGAFIGPAGFFYALIASAMVGGVLAIAVAVRRGVIRPVLLGCRELIVHGLTLGRRGSRPPAGDPAAITIPYGAAIALGSIATWFLLPQGS